MNFASDLFLAMLALLTPFWVIVLVILFHRMREVTKQRQLEVDRHKDGSLKQLKYKGDTK